MYSDSPAMKT